jgi:hypothetical protein
VKGQCESESQPRGGGGAAGSPPRFSGIQVDFLAPALPISAAVASLFLINEIKALDQFTDGAADSDSSSSSEHFVICDLSTFGPLSGPSRTLTHRESASRDCYRSISVCAASQSLRFSCSGESSPCVTETPPSSSLSLPPPMRLLLSLSALLALSALPRPARARQQYTGLFPNGQRVTCPPGATGCVDGLCPGVGECASPFASHLLSDPPFLSFLPFLSFCLCTYTPRVLTILGACLLFSIQSLLTYPPFQSLPPFSLPHPRFFIYQPIGHTSCAGSTPTLNPFGVAFRNAGYQWTRELCMADSDGDGLTNGQELGDPCCRWTQGAVLTEASTCFVKSMCGPPKKEQKKTRGKKSSCPPSPPRFPASVTHLSTLSNASYLFFFLLFFLFINYRTTADVHLPHLTPRLPRLRHQLLHAKRRGRLLLGPRLAAAAARQGGHFHGRRQRRGELYDVACMIVHLTTTKRSIKRGYLHWRRQRGGE